MMSLSVWLPGPMFLPGGLCEVGVLCERGRRPPATEVGDTHPTGMHSCYVWVPSVKSCKFIFRPWLQDL